ncbi:TetR/AcrR family transcriptional regulator [Mycolicibacterium sp. 3033]|nr:TetR/AcrR family transcriptional regulator [Mycolicibacterium aurantiacum]
MPPAQKRPRDRKAQIARAASDAFSTSGFHAVSMEQIAARVGVSAAALYRHAPSKYDLFRDAILGLSEQLVTATGFADAAADVDPAGLRHQLLNALIDTSLANRAFSGPYRWEGRYLRAQDRAVLAAQVKLVHRRLHRPLMQMRPNLTSLQRWTLSSAALSVIGSIADHHATLSTRQIRALLSTLASDVLDAELPTTQLPSTTAQPSPTQLPAVAPLPTDTDPGMKYEALLQESLKLFHKNGYHDTTIADIAAAAGVPASGIYRYFAGKADILSAAFRRAADRVSADLSEALAAESDPGLVLDKLVDAYIARSFANPELAYLYYTEKGNLPAGDARILHNIQRATVERWAQLVTAVRPETELPEARFVVHAAFTLVVDLGRLADYDDSAETRTLVRTLLRITLFGAETLRRRGGLPVDGLSA